LYKRLNADSAENPNLSLTMNSFSISTDEHVPLNYRYI